jgi:hypothetical protein
MQKAMNVEPVEDRRWTDGNYDREGLYDGMDSLPGLFGTVEEAEREARSKEAFRDAIAESKA